MADRWRPNFDKEFKKEIEAFLNRHEEIPYSDAREFTQAVVKTTIMDIETRQKDIQQAAREMIKEDLDLD